MADRYMHQHVSKMVTLGREFQLGGLYDYLNDNFPKDGQRYQTLTYSASAFRVDLEFRLKLKRPDSESFWNKWENMGLDEHLKASTVAGIIDKYKGASNYLNDRPAGPSQAAQVFICRALSRKEKLDLPLALVNKDGLRVEDDGKIKATHVVVGITYGAEAYCIIYQEFKNVKLDQEALEEANLNLAKITSKMESSLEDNQSIIEFKKQFDMEDKTLLNRLKCRLYSDLQSSPVRECNIYDAYKHCLKLVEQMKSDTDKNQAVPISVQLFPLTALMSSSDEFEALVKFRDADADLVDRCCRVWAGLEQVSAYSDALPKGGRQFGKALKNYQEMLRNSLKAAVIKTRESDTDEELERIVNIAETHSLFKLARLNRWIRYKQAEGEMAGTMTNLAGITYLASQKQVEKELADSFNMKYALVLYVSLLDERSDQTLKGMTDYVENYTKLVSIDEENDETDEEEDEESDGMPWHMIQRKRNAILAQIKEFVDYVDKNKHLENKVQFIVTSNDAGKGFRCHYSVYEAGKPLVTGNKLPVPPTELRLKPVPSNSNKRSSIRVEWDYEDLGYPTQFLVEYRVKDSLDHWKQKKSTIKPGENQLIISYQKGSVMEIRVAADSCIGRSEFSDIVDTELDFSPISIVMDLATQSSLFKRCTGMAALGRQFQLGDLYDYRNDRILADDPFEWKSIQDSTVETKVSYKLKHFAVNPDNKWKLMGLDKHLQISVITGIIDKYEGASNYLKDRTSSSQVTRVLICRFITRQEKLNLPTLMREDVPGFQTDGTHVVVGITYGVEAYCVVFQESKDAMLDQNALQEVEENLLKITSKMESSLADNQSLIEFKEQFDIKEKQMMNRFKCRLYADLQSSLVRECNIYDAYKHCLKLVEQMKTDADKNQAVPISVQLCPLTALIVDPSKGAGPLAVKYRNVNDELVTRCCRIWAALETVIANSDALQKNGRKFGAALRKYQELLRKSLKMAVVKARDTNGNDDEVESVVNIAETHSLFKLSRLNRWIRYKQAERGMAGTMTNLAGITYLPRQKQVEKELADSFNMKYALVLYDSLLDERSDQTLKCMTDYVANYTKLVSIDEESDETDEEEDEESDGMSWHMIQRKKEIILSSVQEFVEHVDKNKHLANRVRFLITSNAPGKRFQYSIYEAGMLLTNCQLPVPSPTELQIEPVESGSKKKLAIRVEWKYEDLGYPTQFLVEYRVKDSSDPWKQQKTTKPAENHLTIKHQLRGSMMEVRVAADSCIGRSQFSDILEAELDLQPPTGVQLVSVTQSTADVLWSKPSMAGSSGSVRLSYRVRYWERDDSSLLIQLEVVNNKCRIKNLKPETTYSVEVVTVSGDRQSEPSQVLSLTTSKFQLRFAQVMAKKCEKIQTRNGMDIYAVPLIKTSQSGATADRFDFGEPSVRKDGQQNGRVQHKTILLIGASGSGKTTLINAMMNYIFDVQLEDPFRFYLIQKRDDVSRSHITSQTSKISAYTIHYSEGMRVPYSLTIVDTPGYERNDGLMRDGDFTEMIHQFLGDRRNQELDVVGFVVQASLPRLTPTQRYIFDSVFSIFGNDIKENINYMLTFADSQKPPVLEAIMAANSSCSTDANGKPLHNKFNNSSFFCSNCDSGKTVDKFTKFFWSMGMDNFEKFFNVLSTMKTKSLALTKEVLEERKQLEMTINSISPLIQNGQSNGHQAVQEKVDAVTKHLKRLEAITLRPNQFSSNLFTDTMIEEEKHVRKSGFVERIQILEQLQIMVDIENKIRNEIPLFQVIS